MPTPETIKTDNGKAFLSRTFKDLLDEMEGRGSTTLTLTRDDGGAVAMLTTNPDVIKAIKGYQNQIDAILGEADHAGE